ncbi:hypothetical protein HPB47_019121 [Ixodes persulcatus]|uniref:Uncharacterized protein n=1 Tax=Ixodes persulcatus TaxID=34615 RepID=A0AC60QIZ3_IXOPE|nr:hypothetical protein HPB47_019121 [Ixodes persulcatus]
MANALLFLRLGVAEKTNVDCLMRKSYKRALGLPDSTSNVRFAPLGLHNAVDEIVSVTGLHILRSLGIRYDCHTGPKCAILTQVCTALLTQPIMKQMQPIHKEGRRRALKHKALFVVSDSQHAIRQFAKGHVLPQTAKILRVCAIATSPINLICTPAHLFLPGNEEAHRAVRGLIGGLAYKVDPSTTSLARRDGWVTFQDVLYPCAGSRDRYPPALAALNNASTVAWRRLQTNSYPNPSTLRKWYPDRYSPKC